MIRYGAVVCRICSIDEHGKGVGSLFHRKRLPTPFLELPADGECVGAVAQAASEIDAKHAFLAWRFDTNPGAGVHLKWITGGGCPSMRRVRHVDKGRRRD